MERLWSPWRYEYLTSGGGDESSVCVFCEIQKDPGSDEKNFVLHRASYSFIVLNIYPYISGHLLIVPFEHVGELDAAAKETTDELMDLTKRCQTALREVYQPGGFNVGLNLGRSAGAGIPGHLHLHLVPRWNGDTNFMPIVGNTKVISQSLDGLYALLTGRKGKR